MRLRAEQWVTIRRRGEHCLEDQAGIRSFAMDAHGQLGFTMIELITVLIIVGIMAVVAIPRFMGRTTFDSRSFSDEVKATLRLAQKLAIAQHRNVCVNVVTAAPASLTINVTGAANCDTPLPSLSGSGNYQITAPGGAALTQPAANTTITFDALGSPGAANITLQVDAEPAITVEKETGYVH